MLCKDSSLVFTMRVMAWWGFRSGGRNPAEALFAGSSVQEDLRMQERLISLDVFRGWTIGLMILVNHPGSWAHIPPPLRHASWHGLTLADVVFPFFLFIVGIAMALSFARQRERGIGRGPLVRKVLRRSAIIFGLGLFLSGFPFALPLNAELADRFGWQAFLESLETLRFFGVLQRIALCYLIVGLTVLVTSRGRDRVLAILGGLAVYELCLRLPLVTDWGAGSFALEDNFVRYLDLKLWGAAHLYRGAGLPFDPEGLLSTLPAAGTVMCGFLVGEISRGPGGVPVRTLAVNGALLLFLGLIMIPVEPVNKQLWTLSFMLVTCGLGQIIFALAARALPGRPGDEGRLSWIIRPAVVLGSNPLLVFLGSGLLARLGYLLKVSDGLEQSVSIQRWSYQDLFLPLAGELGGSLLHAVGHLIFWLGVLWVLHRKRIFWKI